MRDVFDFYPLAFDRWRRILLFDYGKHCVVELGSADAPCTGFVHLFGGFKHLVDTLFVDDRAGEYFDENGDPVEGAAIQFCDDSSCSFGKTDAQGTAEFNMPEGTAYEVHVLQAPEGYESTDKLFTTLDTYSDLRKRYNL